MARRSVRVGLVSGVFVLALAAAGLWLVNTSTTSEPKPAEKFSTSAAAVPASATTDRPATGSAGPSRPAGHPSTPPVPALAGDGYARNVVSGASCAPVGGRGFTSQSRLMICRTTATDRHPRWRIP